MKEISNNDYVVNRKSVENSSELDQNLWLEINPNFAQNTESESPGERSKRISSKVSFSFVRDPNIW